MEQKTNIVEKEGAQYLITEQVYYTPKSVYYFKFHAYTSIQSSGNQHGLV